LNRIKKKQFAAKIPSNLIELIIEKIAQIDTTVTDKICEKITLKIQDNKKIYADEYDKFLEESASDIQTTFQTNLLAPLFSMIEKPLENIGIGDENSKSLMLLEISEQLFSIPGNGIMEILKQYFADVEMNINVEIINLYQHKDIQDTLTSFF
jgi:hypothetical protein